MTARFDLIDWGRKFDGDQAVRAMEFVVLGVVFLIAATIVVLLPRGLDFSDTGYYYNSFFNLDVIDIQSTQFAIPWQIFTFTESILFHRALVLAIILACAYFLLRNLAGFVMGPGTLDWIWHVRLAAFACIAIIPYYRVWVPDPSYNSMGFSLLMVLFALAIRISQRLGESAKSCRVELVAAGLIMFPILLVRPPAPIIVILAILPLVLGFARPKLPELGRAILWVAAGAIAYLVWQIVFVESLATTIERFQGGAYRRELLGRGDVFKLGFEHFRTVSGQFIVRDAWTLLPGAAFVSLILSRDLLPDPVRRNLVWFLAGALVLMVASLFFRGIDVIGIFREPWTAELDFRVIGFGVGISAFCALAFTAAAGLITGRPAQWLRSWVVVGTALVVGLASFFGGGSGWIGYFAFYFGLTVAAILIVTSAGKLRAAYLPVLLFATAVSFLATKNAQSFPYRLPAPLSDQTVLLTEGRGLLGLRVDESTHSLIREIQAARARLAVGEPAPALIDLSGRLPMVAHLLGASTPRTPWAMSGYPGSQASFDHTYEGVDEAVLATAWILESPDWSLSLDPGVIEREDRRFPEDYELVAEGWSDYIQSPVRLWAPR